MVDIHKVRVNKGRVKNLFFKLVDTQKVDMHEFK